MVNLGPIGFQLGLPLNNINVNDEQNKFEVHISNKLAKIANLQPKISQDAVFAKLQMEKTRQFFIRF